MILPEFPGHAGGKAELLVHELAVSGFAHAEAGHRPDLHITDHLRRRNGDHLAIGTA
jgi:hypothetical protein